MGMTMRLEKLHQTLGALVEAQHGLTMRRLVLVILAVQVAGCLAAAYTQVMLHADGAYFVYALSVGEAWLLKWRDIAARASVFITTVAPTEWIAGLFHLGPLEISRLNGFVFYLVPALQLAIACALVWRSHPQYLIFPAAQYVLSTALGFGFPSEILLAPGFLWIALFLILKNRALSVAFIVSFAGLLFSHELAFPAALVAAYLAVKQARDRDRDAGTRWRAATMLLAVVGAIALLLIVRLSGGGAGSNPTAIYVIDPRRVLNDPTIWTAAAFVLATIALTSRFPSLVTNKVFMAVLLATAVAFPLVLEAEIPAVDFEQGRYDSARTAIGGVMFVLALCFAAVRRYRPKHARVVAGRWASQVPLVLAVALAVSVGSGCAFLEDWSIALYGLDRVVAAGTMEVPPQFIPYEQARDLMLPREALANDHIDFQWVLPYRSAVLADGGTPKRIVFLDSDYRGYCAKAGLISPERSRIPEGVLAAMQRFSCTHVPPPPANTIKRRIANYLDRLWARIFGGGENLNPPPIRPAQ